MAAWRHAGAVTVYVPVHARTATPAPVHACAVLISHTARGFSVLKVRDRVSHGCRRLIRAAAARDMRAVPRVHGAAHAHAAHHAPTYAPRHALRHHARTRTCTQRTPQAHIKRRGRAYHGRARGHATAHAPARHPHHAPHAPRRAPPQTPAQPTNDTPHALLTRMKHMTRCRSTAQGRHAWQPCAACVQQRPVAPPRGCTQRTARPHARHGARCDSAYTHADTHRGRRMHAMSHAHASHGGGARGRAVRHGQAHAARPRKAHLYTWRRRTSTHAA